LQALVFKGIPQAVEFIEIQSGFTLLVLLPNYYKQSLFTMTMSRVASRKRPKITNDFD
jgi:hypothetical protein